MTGEETLEEQAVARLRQDLAARADALRWSFASDLQDSLDQAEIDRRRLGEVKSCLEADLDVMFEVLADTFVLHLPDDPLRLAVHVPDGLEEPGGAPSFDLYVIGVCPACGGDSPLLPPLHDEHSVGLAVKGGRVWEWHACSAEQPAV